MRVESAPWVPFAVERQGLVEGLGLGLAVMMWNYSGWDTPSTCLGETRAPERAYRRAVFTALPIISLAYLLPVGAGLAASRDWDRWETGHLPLIADAVGGPWLAGLVTAGALLATGGLFLSLLLTNSRLPYVLAVGGQMPRFVATVHPRLGTPWVAVVLSSVCYSLFAFWSFKELIVLDIWLYSISLLVELAAFVALRLREPGLARPWKVGGGAVGLWITAGLPSALCVLAMATAGWGNTAIGILAALTGPLAYRVWAVRTGRLAGAARERRDLT
jgi:amino acid transporter